MTADGKARLAEAQRRRWAAQRKAAKKSAKVKATPARKTAPAAKRVTKA